MIPTLASLALGLALGQVVYLDYLWRTRSIMMPPPPPPDPPAPALLLAADLGALITEDTICDLAELARRGDR